MIKATRRKFMSLVGAGAAASPLALKAVADDRIMQMTGAQIAAPGFMGPSGAPPDAASSYNQRLISASEFINLFGLPSAVEAGLRRHSWVGNLDPDLAAKRSWSMCVKFQEQRARNYARRVAEIHESAAHLRANALLKQTTGFDWPF